jgi:hypothetical protein
MDTLRGADSTGVMTLRKDFTVDTLKTLMPGDRFVQSPRYQKDVKPGWCQVGHNRAATKGKVNTTNAHPFIFGDVTLVHNGTLWGGGNSLPTYNDDLPVDSMQIAHALAEHTPEEATAVLKEIDGSFALVWFDKRDKSVNMARNGERPMHYGLNQDKDMLWFMSDGHMLHTIIKSMGGDKAAAKGLYVLERHKHLKWVKGELVPEVTTFDPFVRHYPTSPRRDDTGKNLKETVNTWQRMMEEGGNTPTKRTSGCEYPQVRLGGTMRKIPEPMVNSLLKEYDLTPNSLLQFKPKASIPIDNIHHMVRGVVVHEEWGEWEIESILYNAKTVQVGAYMDQSWLVRPVGLSFPWDKEHDVPGITCLLVHCDWKSYKENLKEKEAQDEGKVIPFTAKGWIIGPGSVYMERRRIAGALESGCIGCGMAIPDSEIERTMLVNEGRDLLCGPCVEDLKKHPVDNYGVH